MTIDEAIALACREVPECTNTLVGAGVRPSVYWPSTPQDDPHAAESAHTLWFDAAWEWLATRSDYDSYTIRPHGPGPFPTWSIRHEYEAGMGRGSRDIGPFSTKYHALATAVRLAKGTLAIR